VAAATFIRLKPTADAGKVTALTTARSRGRRPYRSEPGAALCSLRSGPAAHSAQLKEERSSLVTVTEVVADAPDSLRTCKNGVPPAPDLRTRVALSRSEAAASLGCSFDFFEDHVQGDLRLVRRGRLVLVPVKELEAWVSRYAARTL
jgi:hypothetical protein